jgi:hypothetical protein
MDDAERAALLARITPVAGHVHRLAVEQLTGHNGPISSHDGEQVAQYTEPVEEFPFARRDERIAEAQAAHRILRRRADAEVAIRERVHAKFVEWYGPAEADRMMR